MNGLSWGGLITQARQAAGRTQLDLAGRLHLKRETLSRWERDMLTDMPPAELLQKLCEELPQLSELELLVSRGYLKGLVDIAGNIAPTEGAALAASLSDEEVKLVRTFRRLTPILRRVVLRQVQAALLPPPRFLGAESQPHAPGE